MFGIEDPFVSSAFLLCIVGAVVCVIYGALNWNKGDEPVEPDDVRWVDEEKKVEEEL